jgi:hypothetical protein
MSHYAVSDFPSLAALDKKAAKLLRSSEAKKWSVPHSEYEICRVHPLYWMENYLYIKPGEVIGGSTEDVGHILFKPTFTQLKVADKICRHLVPDKWERIFALIEKHRKAGISTLIAGFDYWFARFMPGLSEFVVADLASHTDNIMAMIDMAHKYDTCGVGSIEEDRLPIRRIPIPGAKKGIKFSNGSLIEQDTGENPNPATSGTPQIVHMSESAKWRDPRTSETSILNSVPRAGFVFVVKESTAFGLNKFAEDCEKAWMGQSEWEFIFVSWKDMPDCQIELGDGEVFDLEDDEKKLVEAHGLTKAHVKFRRKQISLLGSELMFRQDYPLDPKEPFLVSGTNYFNTEKISERVEEIKFFRLLKVSGTDKAKELFPKQWHRVITHPRGLTDGMAKLEDNNATPKWGMMSVAGGFATCNFDPSYRPENGAVQIFRPPSRDRKYLVIVDVAEGKKSSEYISDNSVVEVLDCAKYEQVAEWSGTFDEEMTALQAILLARYYNNATLVPEMNNRCGGLLQSNIEKVGYSYVYKRKKIVGNLVHHEYGWLTTVGNKADVCGQLKQDFKNGDILVHSLEALEEMLYFIDAKGKLSAASGHTDDRIMSLSIGAKVRSETPAISGLVKKRVALDAPVNENITNKILTSVSRDNILRRYR